MFYIYSYDIGFLIFLITAPVIYNYSLYIYIVKYPIIIMNYFNLPFLNLKKKINGISPIGWEIQLLQLMENERFERQFSI